MSWFEKIMPSRIKTERRTRSVLIREGMIFSNHDIPGATPIPESGRS